jgi:hypothetical protein
MTDLSVQDVSNFKKEFEEIARQNNVTVLYGTAKLEEVNQTNNFIRVKCDSSFKWNDFLEKIGQSINPYVVMDVYTFDEDDFDLLPEKDEVTKDILGENYETVKKKLKKLEAVLLNAQIGDITTIIITANVGNYLVQQTYFSILSDIIFFDMDDYIVEESDEEKEIVKPPSKAEMKKLQESLRQSLMDDPMILNCTNKSLRQSFLRDKVDELELHETAAYFLLRDSQHIVELAFAQMKKN